MAGVAVVEEKLDNPQLEDDAFLAAFDQLSAATDAARTGDAPPVKVETPVAKVEESTTPKGDAPPVKVETPAEGDAPPVKVETPVAQTPPKPAGISDEEIARIAQIAAQVQRPQPVEERQVAQEQQIYTPEDIEFLQSYQSEYSDIVRGEALLRRKDILDAVRFIFTEVNRAVAPTQAMAQQLMARTHLGDVQRLVPENRLTREEAVAWAQKQPDFLQPSYLHVIQRGTPEQVAQFTALVRSSQTVPVPVAGAPGNVVVAAQNQQTENLATKKALAALVPVDTKRSGITVDAIEPGNFDSAFDRYSAQFDAAKK